MASVTDRSPEQFDLGTRGAYPSGGLDSTPPEASSGTLGKLSDWWTRQPLTRFVSASLTRRILLSNLFGLAIFLFGILYLSQHRGWLIDAKRESLRVQGEIIAQAIASNATMEGDRLLLDADKLPEAANARIPFRDDGFAALELSIRPERVTPILRRLIQPTNTRARIYARDGTLIVDTAMLLTRGNIERAGKPEDPGGRVKTKSWYTRLTHWMIDKELPVYREIGSAPGTLYAEVRMAIQSGTPTPMLLMTEKFEQIVSMAVPIQRMKSVHGVLLLSTRPGEIDEILWEERIAILTLALIALVATVSTSLLLARTVAGPMRRLSASAENVSNNINARTELPQFANRRDEVGQMADAFSRMTSALYRRIESSEKFAADVAHELKNPLTAARSTAEALTYARNDEQRDQLVKQINRELMRLNRLITDVSSASRLDAELARQKTEPVAILTTLDSVLSAFGDKAASQGARVVLDIPRGASAKAFTIQGNEVRIGQVITNLVDNAVSFAPPGTTVTISARRDNDVVVLSVEDEGPGIEEDMLERIFARFYTYRPTELSSRGDNSGLGLNISREIVVAHGGLIWAENRYGEERDAAGHRKRIGARFVVRLPMMAPSHRVA
ncbi:MAG: sensor histidine kinase [Hyphomicrobiaceae bacterium]|nr:sensor histidine kinase [Hyphomicrobiaceae bacterium]